MKKINYLDQLIIERDNFYIRQYISTILIFVIAIFLISPMFFYIELLECLKYPIIEFVVMLVYSCMVLIIVLNIFTFLNKEKGDVNIYKLKEINIKIKKRDRELFKERINKNCVLNIISLKHEIKETIRLESRKKKGILHYLTLNKILIGTIGTSFVNLLNKYYESIFVYYSISLQPEKDLFFKRLTGYHIIMILIIIVINFLYYMFYEEFFLTNKLNKLYELEELINEIEEERKNQNSKRFIVEIIRIK